LIKQLNQTQEMDQQSTIAEQKCAWYSYAQFKSIHPQQRMAMTTHKIVLAALLATIATGKLLSMQPDSEIHRAIKTEQALVDAIRTDDIATVKMLLKPEDQVHFQLEGPIHKGSLLFECLDHYEIAKLLLEAGMCPNCKRYSDHGHQYTTPLIEAARHGEVQMTALLLAHKANVDENGYRSTPLNLALHHSIIRDPEYLKTHDYAMTIKTLIAGKANLETSLWWAASNRDPRLCKQLISLGADPYKQNAEGNTAFDALKENCWMPKNDETRLILLGQDTLYGKTKAILSSCCTRKKDKSE
jgi:hypothetical protein